MMLFVFKLRISWAALVVVLTILDHLFWMFVGCGCCDCCFAPLFLYYVHSFVVKTLWCIHNFWLFPNECHWSTLIQQNQIILCGAYPARLLSHSHVLDKLQLQLKGCPRICNGLDCFINIKTVFALCRCHLAVNSP